MRKSSKSVAAYIAGIVDGEGYVGISKDKTSKGLRGFRYRARIQIEMTNLPILRWIKLKTGFGRILPRPLRNVRWRPQHVYVISDHQLAPFIKTILPFLRIKKRQAKILYKFSMSMRHPGVKGHNKKTNDFQDSSYRKIRALNRRGNHES